MLAPLTEDGVRALAGDSAVDPAELHRQTGGNPFFVSEVLAAGGMGVPESVRDAVLSRAAGLGPAARELLDTAAVIGMRAETDLLGALAQDGVEECLAAGVLQRDERGVAFRHELARQAVEEAIEPLRRAELHRQSPRRARASSRLPITPGSRTTPRARATRPQHWSTRRRPARRRPSAAPTGRPRPSTHGRSASLTS